MTKDNTIGIIVILGIVAIGLFGGTKGASKNGLLSNGNQSPEQKQKDIGQQIQQTQRKVDDLKIKIQAEEDRKTQSVYKNLVNLDYVNRSTNPQQEYVLIRISSNATTTIPVTGWILKSLNSGVSITIPKATYLYFAGIPNTEDNIYLTGGDNLYLLTGISPNGASFKANKCSGYLTQFQTFTPSINSNCPLPKDENLSSIPNRTINDACFDYINSFPRCRIQTETLPLKWSTECQNFIYNKINYPTCINTHKNDKDFYQKDWRVYLKRSEPLWKDRRENIVLYDNLGKIVDTLKY